MHGKRKKLERTTLGAEQRFVDAVAGAEIKQPNRHEPRSKKKQYDADFIAAGALWSPTRPAQTSA